MTGAQQSRFARAAARTTGWSRRQRLAVLAPLAATAIALATAVGLLGIAAHSDGAQAAAGSAALSAANANVPKMLSYSADSAESDLVNAAEQLTGDFKTQFIALTREAIIPAASEQRITTSAAVAADAVVSASPEKVTVLMFLNQTTTHADSPDIKLDSSRVRVQLSKVGDDWLVSDLQPV
ncbi:hypothetical protein [Tomitella biformata]|uniref:hypothetical protein n=1 Tax=Tomitella biformata TaxID=630403 RepID=UPI00046671FB|nr:hypothetical protein [Tomitella biformata]